MEEFSGNEETYLMGLHMPLFKLDGVFRADYDKFLPVPQTGTPPSSVKSDPAVNACIHIHAPAETHSGTTAYGKSGTAAAAESPAVTSGKAITHAIRKTKAQSSPTFEEISLFFSQDGLDIILVILKSGLQVFLKKVDLIILSINMAGV